MKIQTRLNTLEAQLKEGEHLRSAEGAIAVPTTVASVSKFWRAMTEEERGYVNTAKVAVEDEFDWRK